MKRIEILVAMLKLAQANGFDFRSWFQMYIQPEWPGTAEAIRILTQQSRYIALLFSHEFAMAVWKPGAQMQFLVPQTTYTQKNRSGKLITVTRRPFTRRICKTDTWEYHLQQMVVCKDPLSYLRRFLPAPEAPLAKKN
jgi:hypothetical protein